MSHLTSEHPRLESRDDDNEGVDNARLKELRED